MNWEKIKTFYHVAKAGSFTRAAAYLNLSQSAISRSVIGLEDRMGTQLFYRRARGLTLTKQGEILFEAAQKMFADVAQAETLISEEETEPQGLLKVTAPISISTWLIDYAPGFLKRYPKVQLSIIASDDKPNLALGQSDVAIYPSKVNRTGLVERFLIKSHLKLYASADYLKQYGTPKKAEDLDNHKLIAFSSYVSNPYEVDTNWHLRIGKKADKSREPYMQFNMGLGLVRAAQENLGIISISPENPGLKSANLEMVLPDLEGPTIDMHYVYPEQFEKSKRVQVFGDYLAEVFGR